MSAAAGAGSGAGSERGTGVEGKGGAEGGARTGALSARAAGLAACRACGALHRLPGAVGTGPGGGSGGRSGGAPDDAARATCRRCGATVRSRVPHSLQRTWAFLLVGLAAYVPANLAPVMLTSSFAGDTSDTIVSGVLELAHLGNVGIAAIIFFASVCIPVTKFVIVAVLASSLRRPGRLSVHARHRLHRVTELIGRWSMIDVFVIAVLAALIQLGTFITIRPGVGIVAFAVSVVFTMLAATSLDPRLFWDRS